MASGPKPARGVRKAPTAVTARPACLLAALLASVIAAACSDRSSPPQAYDAGRVRRVFEPPPGGVRAVPPHAIRSEGVGPYLLGAPLKDVLELLPRGPRVVLMELERVVDYSLVEAEGGSLIIGVQRPGVSFVTVLDKEIARTENDVGVGTSVKDLRNVMGPETRAPNLLRDPRILVFDYLPNARFVIRDDAVAAVLVGDYDVRSDGGGSEAAGAGDEAVVGRDAGPAGKPAGPPCELVSVEEHEEEIIRAARIDEDERPTGVVPGCFGGVATALVQTSGRIVAVGGEPGKFRRVATQSIPDLTFAGPIDIDGDDRAEVAGVTHTLEEGVLTVRVELFRIDAGRFHRLAARDVYKVSAVSATWIGARLDQIELLLDISARLETLYLGGLYVQYGRERARNVAPLHRVKVAVRPKRPGPGTADSSDGEQDAGAEAGEPRRRPKPDAGVAPRPGSGRAPGSGR